MGTSIGPIQILAWQRTLGDMVAHGTLLAITCPHRSCKAWTAVAPEELAGAMGSGASLWDCEPACPRCGRPAHFMASAGEGTPFRPLRTPAGRQAVGGVEPEAREFTATELGAFTPLDLRDHRLDLSVFCQSCRVLRMVRLDRLIAAKRGV